LAVLFTFNLLSEFQRAIDPALKTYKQPANAAFRALYLRRDPGPKRTPSGIAHVQKLGRLFQAKTAIPQPLTLASANFSEVRSTNTNRRMISPNFAPQLRNLGLASGQGRLVNPLRSITFSA
jgi:hypothetical protein